MRVAVPPLLQSAAGVKAEINGAATAAMHADPGQTGSGEAQASGEGSRTATPTWVCRPLAALAGIVTVSPVQLSRSDAPPVPLNAAQPVAALATTSSSPPSGSPPQERHRRQR